MRESISGLKGLLSIAKEASLRGGSVLSRSGSSGRKIEADFRRDIKIAADRRSEKAIVDLLRKETKFPILTEESGLLKADGAKGDLTWIVDPLDGTMNFSRGMSISCVSIGLWEGEDPVLGAVYDFNRAELFSGIAGHAAWLNGRRISVSSTRSKGDAVLLTGFPSRTDFSSRAIGSFIDNVRSYKKVRLLGSAALSLAYVASGKADAYFEKDIMIWDIAGGAPIVMAAGGKCRIERSPRADTYIVYASNKQLFNE